MNIEETINNIVDRVLNEELSKKVEDAVETISEDMGKMPEDRDEFDGRDSEVVGVNSNINLQRNEEEMGEEEVDEGNAFSAARAEAIEKGEDSFEVDGKTYPVEGEEDEVKEEIEEGPIDRLRANVAGSAARVGTSLKNVGAAVKGDKEAFKSPQLQAGLAKMKVKINDFDNGISRVITDIEKLFPSKTLEKSPELAKLVSQYKELLQTVKNSNNNMKNLGESTKNVVTLSESEMIELIQRLVMEQKEAKGLKDTEKVLKDSKKVNHEAMEAVNKKMKEYVKAGSNEGYEENPEGFPKGNGEMGEDLSMKYHASDAVEEYIDQIARSGGMENLDYDAIKPDEEWIEMNILGDSKTGNSPDYANAVKTDANEKVNDRREKNWLAQEKKKSYQKAVQPVEEFTGKKKSDKAAMSPDEVMSALSEGTEDKSQKKINEDIDRMKSLLGHNYKTQ